MSLGAEPHRPLSILCLGAHSDDIEIGAGGTMLRQLAEHPGSSVRWVVFSGDDARDDEARRSAASFLGDAGSSEVTVHRFRESYFPYVGAEVKDGDILVMHLGIRSRKDPFQPMLDPLIRGLKKRGYCFATLTESRS